ncbi:MAG: CIA30 family protein, partial [Verrucomicrobiales bacterium]
MKLKKAPISLAVCIGAMLSAGAGTPASNTTCGDGMVLADFDGADAGSNWKTVNDNVMGGRSKGGPSFKDGVLTFKGATNTNGGGFSSIRTEPGKFDLSGKAGLQMRVRGDGRTYKAELRTDVKMGRWAVPFRADFDTVAGEWREVFLPIDAFKPTFFGRQVPTSTRLDPSDVESIGFMIYDKKDGAFSLEVDWVKAVDTEAGTATASTTAGVIQTALADGRFGTLAAALKAGNLVGALQGDGPFTVFAPTDEAFAKLPKGTVERLLKSDNRDQLQEILKYHVAASSTRLSAALGGTPVTTLQGDTVSVAFADGRVRVNEAAVIDADILCDNGVIHVIDSVLLPPEPANDIPSVAKRAGSFSTLLAAVEAAGLNDLLASTDRLTILAPTDAAFEKLPKGTVAKLLKPENRDQLQAILSYHAIAGRVSAGDALNAKRADTLGGKSVEFGIESGTFKVNGATIRTTDIACDNGVIHVIDTVLLPQSDAKPAKQAASPTRKNLSPSK